MDQLQLQRFERFCSDMYSSSSAESRRAAHDTLMPLLNQPESIPQLEFVLANSSSPHALLFSSSCLLQLVTNHWTSWTETQRTELKGFLLNYLSQKCAEMYASALGEQTMSFMVRLLCRIVKLAWLEGPQEQTFHTEVQKLMDSGSGSLASLAVDIFSTLTVEMQPSKGPNMSRMRRTAMSFRDIALAGIFGTGMKILKNASSLEPRLLFKVLKLVVGTLSFDFLGTMPDETYDEQSTVMVPYTWTNVKDLSYPSMLFELYSGCIGSGRRESAVLCLQCLVLFASLRRSLYSKEEERAAMLASYMKGTQGILSQSLGLDDGECFHEFCRLLGRVNSANQLTEIAANPEFSQWIDSVYGFTCSALSAQSRFPNSMHYLLGFWTVLVQPVVTQGEKAPAKIKDYLGRITLLFVESRLALVASEEEENEDETLLYEQLDAVSVLAKISPNELVAKIMTALSAARTEKSVAWIVYFLGACVGGASAETAGEIVKRVFQLMARPSTSSQLEVAYLYFLDQFKKMFLAEHAKVVALTVAKEEGTKALCEAVGVASDEELVDLMVRKVFFNFQHRAGDEVVLKKSLGFMHDLIAPQGERNVFASLLGKNKTIQYVLEHHEVIDFGRIDKNYNTVYYSMIFRLMFAEKIVVNWTFFDSLFARFVSGGVGTRSAEQGKLIATLARNLKGVSLAASNAEEYNVLFKYLVATPKNPGNCKISLFTEAAKIWWDEPAVVNPILKFIADFAHNKAQRIAFDPMTSPNGIVLFKEAVKVMGVYGQQMLQSRVFKDVYEEKYKGVGAALALFSNTLGGGYANLGVFEIYGDSALEDAMGTALQLCLSIPLSDLASYVKSLKSVYTFIELVSKNYTGTLCKLDSAQFANLLRALEDGLTCFDTAVALSACVAADNIATFLFENPQESVLNGEVRTALGRQLAILNHFSMTGEFASTWSLSRPFLGLILLLKDQFVQLRSAVVEQQTNPDRRRQVENAYNELMQGVGDNLTLKNRENFTKNLYQFGISLRSK